MPLDPVDARLLAAVADAGRVAVPAIAAHLGMDVREVAARLSALSANGFPLMVGVECDPQGIRAALAASPPMPSPPPPPAPSPPAPPPRADPAQTWGPPGSVEWTRADHAAASAAPQPAIGVIGNTLRLGGPGDHQLSIRLVELMDPADFLFTAAGYQLDEGQRAVIVHSEFTNHGSQHLDLLPDADLVLLTQHETISKAGVTLSSRPSHRPGIPEGATVGGHSVYVLPEAVPLRAVQWGAATWQQARWDVHRG